MSTPRPAGWRRPRAGRAAACALAALAVAAGCGHKKKEKLPWGLGVATFDAVALGLARARTADPFVDGIRPGRLVIPTYDGSGQATHPDVIVERDAGGVRAVMAMTPYPFSNGRLENPSVLVSGDGMRFAPPAGLTNPLVPAPPTDHNNDPDLRRDPRTGGYELLYLESLRPATQVLVALRSPDLVHWQRTDAIVYDLAHGAPFIVSPAAIDHGGKTYLFYVETEARALRVRVSADGRWDPAGGQPVELALGGVTPWHVDVVAGDGAFALLISGYVGDFNHQDLYLATSPDLVHWTLRPTPLLDHADPALAVESLYRSTAVVDHGTLIVWYAMQYRPAG